MLNTNEANICDDCVIPDYCKNHAIATFRNQCRNVIKTVPLDDDQLLKILALTANDIYCYETENPDPSIASVASCPYERRSGVKEWLSRGPVTLYDKKDGFNTYAALICMG